MFDRTGFTDFARQWLPQLEAEMRRVLTGRDASVARHYQMMHYHMGWADASLQPGRFPVGKRIRPLLCLMACEAVGGAPEDALPAAAAIEILHNFSLVHDDIEDRDETRRHRPTLWTLWGEAQAINVGDGMFALAYAALLRLRERDVPAATILAALERFTETCITLTEGQHLDLCFEEREQVSVDEYLRMIDGKTASLLATSLAIGAHIGGAAPEVVESLHHFGRSIGLAFQIRDDILGIWGDPDVTGKAAGNDILRRKKSLPLLYALEHPSVGRRLRSLWRQGIDQTSLPHIMALLEEAGARSYAEESLRRHHKEGIQALHAALGPQAMNSPLLYLADGLLERVT